jgi:uncharacterized protein YndB with AHSA1/START domain
MTTGYGEFGSGTSKSSVRFVRQFEASRDELWAILTEPDRIGA